MATEHHFDLVVLGAGSGLFFSFYYFYFKVYFIYEDEFFSKLCGRYSKIEFNNYYEELEFINTVFKRNN